MFCGFRKRRIKIKIITRPKKSSFDEKKKGNLMASPHAFFPFLRARKVGGMAGGVVSWVNFLLLVLPFFASFRKSPEKPTQTPLKKNFFSVSFSQVTSKTAMAGTRHTVPVTPVEPSSQRREKKHSSEKLSVLGENMVKIYGFKLRLENTLKKKETQENPMRWHDVVTHTIKCRK